MIENGLVEFHFRFHCSKSEYFFNGDIVHYIQPLYELPSQQKGFHYNNIEDTIQTPVHLDGMGELHFLIDDGITSITYLNNAINKYLVNRIEVEVRKG